MNKLQLSIAVGHYDRIRPLVDGEVQIEGVDPVYMTQDPEEIFRLLELSRGRTLRDRQGSVPEDLRALAARLPPDLNERVRRLAAAAVGDLTPVQRRAVMSIRGAPSVAQASAVCALSVKLYDAMLATSPYNVVFQHKLPKEDDGSLSRLAARRGVRYINLEVTLGQREKQMEMLDWLENHLR